MTTRVRRPGVGRAWRAISASASVAAAVAFGLALEGVAQAEPMDPTPERFVTQPTFMGKPLPSGLTCQNIAANPAGALTKLSASSGTKVSPSVLSNLACQPNNAPFNNLISELGFAIAPTAFHPARTTGFGGFNFSIEASYTKINQDATAPGTNVQYWHEGTQGSVDPNSGKQSIVNTAPDSVIQVYSLKMRKGFPFGFEITGDVSYIADTTMWTAGADVRWALMEGFRSGWPSYLPDFSVGGGVRSLTGTDKFTLTTVGIDGQISKPITLGDTSVLSPYVGYQRLQIFGDSSTIDLAPNTSALKACGFEGNNNMGQPICANKVDGVPNNSDFNNNTTFGQVRTGRNRGIIGLNYRYEILYLAGQFLFDLTAPNAENPGLVSTRQWTTSLEVGVYF